jgi:hypothetical protein
VNHFLERDESLPNATAAFKQPVFRPKAPEEICCPTSAPAFCCSTPNTGIVPSLDLQRSGRFPNHENIVDRFCGYAPLFHYAMVSSAGSTYAQSQASSFLCLYVKWRFYALANVLICKLRSVICLYCLNLKRKCFHQFLQEFNRVFLRMFFEPINKTHPCTLVYRCPLEQKFPVFSQIPT